MGRIWELFLFQMHNEFDFLKTRNVKVVLKSIVKFLAIFFGILFFLKIFLGQIFFVLGLTNYVGKSMITIILTGALLILLIFGVANIVSKMFLSKENELLFVLPVKFNDIFLSKILFLYVSDLIFSFTYILPIFYSLAWIGGLNYVFYLLLPTLLLIFPFVSLAIASLIAIPMMFVVKFLNKHTLVAVILTLTLVTTGFVLYMMIINDIGGAFNVVDNQIQSNEIIVSKIIKIGSSIPIIYQLSEFALTGEKCWVYFAFFGGSLVLFFLCFLIIKPFYIKIATITTENNVKKKKKPGKFKERKPLTNLLVNEMRGVFRSPSYIFQYFIFPLLMPLIVFTYDKLLISIAVNQAGKIMIIGSHFLILALISLMSNVISASAISREGGNFYIAKTIPVNFYIQVIAKILFNFIFTASAILVTMVITLIFVDIDPGLVVFGSFSMIILNLGHICQSFDMDLRKPTLDWYDNSEISNISSSTTKSILLAFVLSLASCLIIVLVSGDNPMMGFIGLFIFALIYCLYRIHLLFLRTKYYYNKMEI